jgi:hypothetical protein
MTAIARRPLAALRQTRRAIRVAQALWIAWAFVVWNVVFDHVIVVAGRNYLAAARAAGRGPGPHPRVADWMRPAVRYGVSTATAAALAILVLGFVLIRFAALQSASRASHSI